MKQFLGKVGQTAGFLFAGVSRLGALFRDVAGSVLSAFVKPRNIRANALFEQMVFTGVDSIPIIMLVGAAVGMVLALQAAYQLKESGAVLYTGSLVSVSVTRELGPLVAGIVISGRIGARMAAELGTMKSQEEVDALVTMGLDPVRYLVVLRCLSLMIMLPCLTVITILMAMAGGFAVGVWGVGINPDLYIAKSLDPLIIKDIVTGLTKSGIFAAVIGLVSCHQGLSVEGGADAVGKATTQAVVTSIVMIIVTDCIATAIFFYAFP